MTRIKRGVTKKRKHKDTLKQAKGYYGAKKGNYRLAKEQIMKSLAHSYIDRKNKKRLFRRLWITRINAAARNNGLSYNQFVNGLKQANVEINRKMLSELAVNDPNAFTKLADIAKKQISV